MEKQKGKTYTFQEEVKIFGNNVRQLRTKKKWKQWELAEKCNLDTKQIGFIEQARRAPSLRTILAIKKGLDCKLNDLFKGMV
jgi:transcriptional regulator with XRE-family HTH domain